MVHTAKHMLELTKCDLHILTVKNENLTCVSKALPKIDFTILHRNTIITLCATVCDANNESETNIVIRINACKNFFYLPLSLSIPLLLISFLVFL